jgi:DNA-binding transcriptional ArsR family regulator
MDAKKRYHYTARANVIKALAHPTRLFIVDELARKGEECVHILTDSIGSDMSTVSRHLSILKSAGIIQDDKRGMQVYYRLRMECLCRFLGCVETLIKENASEQQRLLSSGRNA